MRRRQVFSVAISSVAFLATILAASSALAISHPTVKTGWINSLGLKSDGTVMVAGNGVLAGVSSWTGITQITAGSYHAVGLKSDGSVVATGNNTYGQCNVSGWTNIASLGSLAYADYTLGVKTDHSVEATGRNDFGQCNVSGWSNITAATGGLIHTLGLKGDGTVVAAGNNTYHQNEVTGWTGIKAISAGMYHSLGLKSDGSVVATGMASDGQCNVSGWTDIVAISGGGNHSVGLKADGSVVATGSNVYGQCNVSEWRDIVAISADGAYHTLGLKSDGTVVATGINGQNQLDVASWHLAEVDDNIPGLPVPGRVSTGTLSFATDKYDVLAVHLVKDVPARFDCVRTSGDVDCSVFLYPPGANDIWRFEQWLPGWSWGHTGDQTETIEYTPTQTGTHYLLVDAASGAGAYRVSGPARTASVVLNPGVTKAVYPRAHTIAGTLAKIDPGAAVSGARLIVAQRSSGGTWSDVGQTVAASNGTFSFAFTPRVSGDIRVSLAATDGLKPSSAEGRRVNVVALLGKPSVSGKLRAKKSLTFKGTLAPVHRGKVRVTLERKVRGKFRLYKAYSLYASSAGRWTLKVKLPKGDWRARAGHVDADHLQGWSSYRTFRVKR
jgi:hypothetical protein